MEMIIQERFQFLRTDPRRSGYACEAVKRRRRRRKRKRRRRKVYSKLTQ